MRALVTPFRLAGAAAFAPVATLAVSLVTLGATVAAAQTAPHATIHVAARDSSGAVIPGAELTVTQGLREVVAVGTTDSSGQARLYIDGLTEKSDFQVVMRKIGYQRGDQFFSLNPREAVALTITVGKTMSPTLGPVKVTARVDPKYKSYHISADDIANSDAVFYDGWDVVKRLAPDMLTSRGGCETGALNVWVNGKRIRLPLLPTGSALAHARTNIPPRARFSYEPVSVLSDILPEHIEQVVYHDCFDHSMAAVGSDNAIFITLKPGVDYIENVGSFVVDPMGTHDGAP